MPRVSRSRHLQGWLFLLPALLFVGIFVLVPLAQLVQMSLTDLRLLGGGRFVGFEMVLFVSGIQSINPDILEAAEMDGAGYWSRVRLIIVPLTRRIILLTTLVSAIGSMLAFDQFYIMTSGGPRGQTFTAVYSI